MSQASANGSANGSAGAANHPPDNASARALDAYGFVVPTDAATTAARRRCEEYAAEIRPKWTKLRQQLSVNQAREDKIKKYCRRVRPGFMQLHMHAFRRSVTRGSGA